MNYNNDPNALYKNPDYLYEQFIINDKSVQQIADENNTTERAVTWQLYTHGIKKNGNKISKDALEDLYITQNLSIEDVARALGTNSKLVSRYLDKYGIQKQYYKYNPTYNTSHDAEWIDLYINKHLSALQIAKMYGTYHTTVINHLQRNGIQTRTMQTAQRTVNGNYYMHPDLMNPNALMDLHYNYHYSLSVIADIYRCDINVVKSCFNNLGIKTFGARTASSAPPAIYKDHNFESSVTMRARYLCDKYLNPVVLYRDGYKCRLCGSAENLEVHHSIFPLPQIIYICADMHPEYSISDNIDELLEILKRDPLFNDLDNMVSLCSDCHHKVHLKSKNINTGTTVNQQLTHI